MVEENQFIEAGTEVVKDIFSQTAGVVEVFQKNDILREIVIKPGDFHLVDDPQTAMQKNGTLAQPGTEIMPGLTSPELRYVEYLDSTEGPALLFRPVEEYQVPDVPTVPSQESVNQEGRSIGLRAVQRIPYKDGDRVKAIDSVELLKTQLLLEVDTDAPQLAADIEFIPNDTDPGSLRLQLVILESLVIRQDNSGDPAHSNSRTRLLVNDGDRIDPGAVVARTEILCKKPGQIRGIRKGSEVVRRLLVVTEADCITTHCPNPTVQIGELLRSGDEIGDGVITEESGQVLRIENDSVVFRIGRPDLVSP
jgi:DNA-directed RNA polymerase subunit beta'